MMSPHDIGRGMAAAKEARSSGIRLDDLRDKWSAVSFGFGEPRCAACNVKISGEDEDGECQVPIRLWQTVDGRSLELCLCAKCWTARITR